MIILEPLIHRESLCIAVRGRYSSEVLSRIRSMEALKYSSTHKCFYGQYTAGLMAELREVFSKIDPLVEDRWHGKELEESMRRYFVAENIIVPKSYQDHLVKRRYSKSTAGNYEAQFRAFLGFIYPKTADECTDKEIHDYQIFLVKERQVSYSTQNQAINAIKFYLEHVKGGERREYYIERPRREVKLPTVLSEEEMKALLSRTHYIKHKCMLFLLYSGGLRVSELLNLRESDIDPDRRVVHIRRGKGRKARVTLYSPLAMAYVKEYIVQTKPKHWLFEGPGGRQYTASSVNKIIRRSAAQAGIKKRVSAHTLRHSFATHLLENGTDLRYIQALLGHENSKTTERYTQVTRKGFENLISPLDRIAGKGNKDI